MATRTVRGIEVAYAPCGTWEALETPGQTYKKSAVLVFDAAEGEIKEASADPVSIAGIATGNGVNATSWKTRKMAQYVPAMPGVIIEANMVNGATGSHTILGTVVGRVFGLIKRTAESGTPWAINAAEKANDKLSVRVIGMRDASGDVNARVYAVFLASRCAWTGGNFEI